MAQFEELLTLALDCLVQRVLSSKCDFPGLSVPVFALLLVVTFRSSLLLGGFDCSGFLAVIGTKTYAVPCL